MTALFRTAFVALIASTPALAQDTQPAEEPAPAAAAATEPSADADAAGERTLVIVRQPAATVRVFEPAATVTVTQPAPRITVRQYDPIVTVTQHEPEVTVRPREPDVRVELRDPEVIVEQAQPQVAIEQPEASIEVDQPETEVEVTPVDPTVTVETVAPDVAVTTPEPQVVVTQPELEVEIEQAEPNIAIEQTQPNIEVERTDTAAPGAEQEEAVAALSAETPAPDADFVVPYDDIVGKNVVNANGDSVGDIADVVMDPNTNEVMIVVSVGGFLGLAETQLVFGYDEITVGEEQAVLQTAASEDALEDRPEYDEGAYVELPDNMRE